MKKRSMLLSTDTHEDRCHKRLDVADTCMKLYMVMMGDDSEISDLIADLAHLSEEQSLWPTDEYEEEEGGFEALAAGHTTFDAELSGDEFSDPFDYKVRQ